MLVHDPLNAAKLLMHCHSIEMQSISFLYTEYKLLVHN